YDPDDDLARDSSYASVSVYGSGHVVYYENVIDVLRGRCEPDTDGREGLRSLELLTAMYVSARDGRRVSLPLEHYCEPACSCTQIFRARNRHHRSWRKNRCGHQNLALGSHRCRRRDW